MRLIKRLWCIVFGHAYYIDDDSPTQDGLELKCERCKNTVHLDFWNF